MFTAVIVSTHGIPAEQQKLIAMVLFGIGKGVSASDFHVGLSHLTELMALPDEQKKYDGRVLFYLVEEHGVDLQAIEKIRTEQQVDCKIHLLFCHQLGKDSRFAFAQDLDVLRSGGGKDNYGTKSWVRENLGVETGDYPSGWVF